MRAKVRDDDDTSKWVCGSESPVAYSMPSPALKHARTKAQSDSESLPIKRTSLCSNVTVNNLKKEG
jgi:hypothetical protein